jgi:hypothetical protein
MRRHRPRFTLRRRPLLSRLRLHLCKHLQPQGADLRKRPQPHKASPVRDSGNPVANRREDCRPPEIAAGHRNRRCKARLLLLLRRIRLRPRPRPHLPRNHPHRLCGVNRLQRKGSLRPSLDVRSDRRLSLSLPQHKDNRPRFRVAPLLRPLHRDSRPGFRAVPLHRQRQIASGLRDHRKPSRPGSRNSKANRRRT